MSNPLRTFLCEDEPLSRWGLAQAVARHPALELVGEAADGTSAVEAIREKRPDLLLLDVQLPGRDGFEVLHALGRDVPPAIIFTTAFDQYAVAAFEAHAVDYLLKPFDAARFDRAIERAGERLRLRHGPAEVAAMLEARQRLREANTWTLREGAATHVISLEEIRFVRAADNYIEVVTDRGTRLARASLKDAAARLPEPRFSRIHRSFLVNVERVVALTPHTSGDARATLDSGEVLEVTRTHRARLLTLMAERSPGPDAKRGRR